MSATCGLDFERHLSSPAFEVRRLIGEALRELGFQIVVDQMTRIEAKRGGMIGYSLMVKKQMPVLAVFDVSLAPPGCVVVVHLTDNVKNVGKTWGANRQFHELFDEVQRRIDAGLAAFEPAAAASFEPAGFWSRSGDVGILEQGTALTSKAVGSALGAAGKALDRPKDHTPGIWKGIDSVTFESAAGEACLSLQESQAMLGVAVMIASHPASMPPNLLRDVEAFAAIVEQQLTAAGGHAARIEVTNAHKPVFEFLNQQAQIRAALPMRQMYTCRSCRLEKIVNPDYKRIVSRNEKLGDIMAGVGATITKGGISPTFVLGQVFKVKKLDPEYVCSRCQGMEADERFVTFCPTCGDLQRDVVLRLCAKCKFDFRTKAATGPLWSEPRAEVLAEVEAGAGAEAVAGPEAVARSGAETVAGPEAVAVDEAPAEPADAAALETAFEAEVAAIPSDPARDAAPDPEPIVAAEPEPLAAAEPEPPAVASEPAGPPLPATRPPVPAARPPVPAAPPRATPPAPVQPAPAVNPAPPATRPAAWPPPPQPNPFVRSQTYRPAPVAWTHPLSVPFGQPAIGPRGGKVCSVCRQEHPVLWRVVVATPIGYEERFLCGSTPSCQMASLVVATRV